MKIGKSFFTYRIVVSRSIASGSVGICFLEGNLSERVKIPSFALRLEISHVRCVFIESRSLGFERKMCGMFHIKLNMGARPIANKYCEGKMKRTLKRELKVPEIAGREAIGTVFLYAL